MVIVITGITVGAMAITIAWLVVAAGTWVINTPQPIRTFYVATTAMLLEAIDAITTTAAPKDGRSSNQSQGKATHR